MAKKPLSHELDDPPAARQYIRAVRERRSPHPYATLLGLKGHTAPELHRQIQAGFSFVAFETVQNLLDYPAGELAAVIGIPARTFQRRRESGRLRSDESDRLARLAKLIGGALELFEGDVQAARRWFGTSVPALGGATPLEMAATEPGAQEVLALLGRLEHGVIS